MQIRSTQFVKSSQTVSACPQGNMPEYAFIGRSNVGKSSCINMLTNHGNLAKISSKPGKTQLINHFIINNEWYLVDLPGYGYAKTAKNIREGFAPMISDYILRRPNLAYVFVLIDSRLNPQKIDLDFLFKLGENEIPFALIFTKSDKLSAKKTNENIQLFLQTIEEYWETLPPYFVSSAVTKTGREEILNFIEQTNLELKNLQHNE